MATTIQRYNHTAKLFLNQEIVLANLKIELLNNSATFDATHTAVTNVDNAGAYEVSGNGWDAGGEAISGAAVTVVATNGAMLDAADVSVTASGGTIGPAYKALIKHGTSPLFFITFDNVQDAGDGTDFKFVWNANGIFRVT